MNTYRRIGQQSANWWSRAAILVVFAVGVTGLLFWLAGTFEPKVAMQTERVAASENKAPGSVAEARLVRLPLVETAVGTIRPVHETKIGAKLLARVNEVNLKAGQVVEAGDVLVRSLWSRYRIIKPRVFGGTFGMPLFFPLTKV